MMKWLKEHPYVDPKTEWHVWFAWHPVQIGRWRVWLQFVNRKGEWAANYGGGGYEWRYKFIW